MSGFFSKIFGGKKKEDLNSPEGVVRKTLEGLISVSGFDLDFDLSSRVGDDDEPQIHIEFTGSDEELLKEKEGQLIDAIQLYLKRVLQHNIADDRSNIVIDCNGFKEESNQALIDLAEKLKGIALEKGKSVYFRALPPRDRKVIHQYLANDTRVKSRSIGEGLYKKIKIYPIRGTSPDQASADT